MTNVTNSKLKTRNTKSTAQSIEPLNVGMGDKASDPPDLSASGGGGSSVCNAHQEMIDKALDPAPMFY